MGDQSFFLAWQQSRQSKRPDRSWGAGDEGRTISNDSEGWIHLTTLCCKLDLPIFNPTPISVNTRSSRGNLKSFITRQVPRDFRGRNAVLKGCRVQKDYEGRLKLDFGTVLSEVIILSNPALRLHSNLARLIGVTWEEEPPELALELSPALVLDFADGGTLADLVQRKPSLSFTMKTEIFCGIGEALLAIHRCGIVHGDVKMENVLIQTEQNGRHVPKLTDFDLSMRAPHSPKPLPGYTCPWNAPEIFEELCHCCMELTDVYSFGMLVWAAICDGRNPFDFLGCVGPEEEGAVEHLKLQSFFIDKVCQSLEFLGLEASESSIAATVFQNTLTTEPELRNLHQALSCMGLQVVNSLSTSEEEPAVPLSLEWYNEAVHDRDFIVIDHDHLRFVDPRFKSYLATCLDKVSHHQSSRQRQGEALIHLSAAFFAGFGVQQDHKHALELLVQGAEYGCLRAQALVKRMHDAMRIECPPNLPIQAWLVAGVETGSLIAAKDLRSYYPELYSSAIETFRTAYHGIGRRILGCATVTNQEEAVSESHRFNLHAKVAHGDLESVLSLLAGAASSSSINSRNLSGDTPLLCACRSGNLAIVQILLDQGADASINSYSGESPMHWLSSFSDSEIPTIGQHLLDSGAMLDQHADSDVTHFPHFFNGLSAGTPLLRSVARGSKAAVEWLLQQGAQPSHNQYEESHSKTSSRRKDVYLSGDWLGAKGLRSNSSISLKQKKSSPVANACAGHHRELTEILLQAETVDLLNCHATTASHYGFWDRFRDEMYTKAIAWTTDYSVEPADTDAFDRLNVVTPELTLLYFACGGESVFARMAVNGSHIGEAMKETIDLLVANGASLSHVNKYGASALHAAVEGGNVDVAKYLLTNYQICRQNVDTPYQGCKSLRPIHLAILQDDIPMFRLLLDFGASISWGIQACAAANHQNLDFFRELVVRGATPGPHPPFNPPLPPALIRRHFLLADAIIRRWPEILQLEVDGFNILQFAVVHIATTGSTDVSALMFLLSHLRERNITLCGPHRYFKSDIIGVLIASSWGGRKIEPLDDDWEQAETIKRTCNVLLAEYGQHKNVNLGRGVHAAVETRNLVALKALLEYGADPNYISEVFDDQKLGFAPMDRARRYLGLGYLKINVPVDVEQAGDKAVAKYKQRSQSIASLLRKYGAKTAYEQKGPALYGERVGAVIGYVLTFRILSDLFSGRTVGDIRWWIKKRKTWINRNVPYM